MSNAKTSISRRFLAALLSFVLVLGLLPTSTLTAFAATAEHPDAITVSVTDQDGKALAGVTVAYSVTIAKAEITDIVIAEVTAPYNEKDQNIVALTGKFLKDDDVHWYVNGSDTGSAEIPQAIAVGKYAVRLTVNRGNNYELFDKTVNSEIVLGNIDLGDLKITANELTYNGNDQEAITVNNQGDYTLQYRLSETDTWKEYDKAGNSVPMVKNAGDYTVYIKAVKDSYNDKEYPEFPLNVHVEKAEQSLAFNHYTGTTGTDQISGEVPYGKTYDFAATDSKSLAGGSISYEIETDEEDIASINAETGLLTVNYPGTITVKATLTGNDNYKDCVITYTLDVSGAVAAEGNYIYFEKGEVSYTLGTDSTISTQTATKRNNKIRGRISYTLDQEPGVRIGLYDGKVTVTDYDALADAIRKTTDGVLKLTVTATKPKSGRYDKDTARYIICFELSA